MLLVFSPTFVADTKIIYGCSFVAPLVKEYKAAFNCIETAAK